VSSDAVLIVVNPTAGGGRARRLVPWLTDMARRGHHQLLVTTAAGDAERAAAAGIHERIVAVGGDGTVQEVVNGMAAAHGAAVLGIVPAGQGNDLARALGVPRDGRRALGDALDGSARRIDIGQATGSDGRVRRFASAGGTGFDAQVAHAMARPRAAWHRSRVGYLLSTLDELRGYRNVALRLSWVDGDQPPQVAELSSLFVAFANGAYYGGGMRIAPRAALDDGKLDLCIVGDIGRGAALLQIPGIYRGRHVRHPLVRMARAQRLRIDGDGVPVHLDGEPFGHLPLDVTILPGALRVAVAPAPASAPPTR
jgi:diacylglycerol kinase (ATP)